MYSKMPTWISLTVIALVLGTSVAASLMFPKKVEEHDPVVHDPLAPRPGDGTAPIPGDDTAPPA